MKFKELKNKAEPELKKLLVDFREKLRDLRFRTASDQVKNIRELRDTKKIIAKIMFLLGQKKKDSKNTKETK